MVNVTSAIARIELGTTPPDTESQIEYLAWFRFPVTWAFINDPESESDSEVTRTPPSAPPPLTRALILPVPVSAGQVSPDVRGGDGLRAAVPSARWEMMVPKMTRPPARPVATLEHATQASLAPPTRQPVLAPAPAIPPVTASAPNEHVAPSLPFHEHEPPFLARQRPQMVFAAVAIVVIGGLMWGLSGPSQSARSAASPPVKAVNWSHQAAPSGRSLTVYEPSRGESDYRMEFSWVPDSAGVGWVFRTRDANNYYAARLTLQQPAIKGVLMAEHFNVFEGAESVHSRKVVPLGAPTGLVRVHMDAIGPVFKLFVEDNPADSWTDARFNSGALGFYDDGDHLPKLLALSFTFIKNQVTRTAVASLP